MNKPLYMWIIFISVVLFLLFLDLGVFHKKDKVIGLKQSLKMSFFYILIAFIFGLWIGYMNGLESFAEYITGFLVEKSLAIDNIFLISMIFSTFSIPQKYQHRVLFWGIIGVIVLRAAMITLGAQMLSEFAWILYFFAAFMIFTGVKMFFVSNKKVDISENLLLILMRKRLNITDKLHDQNFFVYQKDQKTQKNKLFVTPLFVALVMIEFTDLVFAVDSIPAIFSITQDVYIVYTSNIFAILGLRALYFALISIIDRFHYLKYSLAVILIFIGTKIFVSDGLGIIKISPVFSLIITLSILIWGVVYSYVRKTQDM
jgi:tellurite resistance protein TerC